MKIKGESSLSRISLVSSEVVASIPSTSAISSSESEVARMSEENVTIVIYRENSEV